MPLPCSSGCWLLWLVATLLQSLPLHFAFSVLCVSKDI